MVKKTLKKAQYGSPVGSSKPNPISKTGKDFLKKIGKTSPSVSPEIKMPNPYSKVKPASPSLSPADARKIAKKALSYKKSGGSVKSKKK